MEQNEDIRIIKQAYGIMKENRGIFENAFLLNVSCFDGITDDDYESGFYDYANSRYDNVYQIISAVFYSLIPHFEIGVK